MLQSAVTQNRPKGSVKAAKTETRMHECVILRACFCLVFLKANIILGRTVER